MATAPKTFPAGTRLSGSGPPTKRQLRRDRTVGLVVVVIIALLMGLMIWLASFGDGIPEHLNYYWPMMP